MRAFKITRGTQTYFRVDLPRDAAQGTKRRSVTAKTKTLALKKAQAEIERAAAAVDRCAPEKTLGDFLTDFIAYYKTDGGVAPSTIEDYRYHIDHHLKPILGRVLLNGLTARHVDQCMSDLRAKKLSQRTVNYTYSVLRRALQFAVDWKLIPVNPASSHARAAKRRQMREPSRASFLTVDQSKKFLESLKGHRLEALYVLAITTGMRQGEILGLEWRDADLRNGRITIRQALHRTKRRRDSETPNAWFELRSPKTPQSQRSIEIPPMTVEALRAHQKLQEVSKRLAGPDWKEQDLVFTTRTGGPIDTSNVLHQFQDVLKKAGLPKVRFYDLRHTHASLLIADGVHPKQIAERLGHGSIKLTMDTYGHLFEGSDKESAGRMQRMFRPAAKD